MPYIEPELRPQYDKHLNQIKIIHSKGELEYCIYKLMLIYTSDKPKRYANLHATAYAAKHCGHEFLRNFLDKREDKAKEDNGDIYV